MSRAAAMSLPNDLEGETISKRAILGSVRPQQQGRLPLVRTPPSSRVAGLAYIDTPICVVPDMIQVLELVDGGFAMRLPAY